MRHRAVSLLPQGKKKSTAGLSLLMFLAGEHRRACPSASLRPSGRASRPASPPASQRLCSSLPPPVAAVAAGGAYVYKVVIPKAQKEAEEAKKKEARSLVLAAGNQALFHFACDCLCRQGNDDARPPRRMRSG